MVKAEDPRAQEVLDFWFGELSYEGWFKKDTKLDEAIRARFLTFTEAVAADSSEAWTRSAGDCLGAVIALDQFSRNMFRGSARAFENDPKAVRLAKMAIDAGFDAQAPKDWRVFFYMPLEHSENLDDQDRCCVLMAALGVQDYLDYAEAHRAIIRRFGRFPHRNEALGRASTAEEIEFLNHPGSSF